MIPFLNKGPTGHGGAKGEIPDRYAGFQTFMSAAETSPFIKVFYGISRHKTIKSGDLLVKERTEKSLFQKGLQKTGLLASSGSHAQALAARKPGKAITWHFQSH